MRLKPVPTALLAAGILAGTAGTTLAAAGAKNELDARRRERLAEEHYLERRSLSDRRRGETHQRLAGLARLQQESYADAVQRMIAFLKRNERNVRQSDLSVIDRLEVVAAPMPQPAPRDIDVEAWMVAAAGTAAVARGTSAAIRQGIHRYGVASTGRPIAELAGAAKEKATLALLGGGSRKSGGGGIALGTKVQYVAVAGPTLLTAGVAAKLHGTMALTRAKQFEAEAAVACADLDLADEYLSGVDRRIDEVSRVLTALRSLAVAALDELESEAFVADLHAERFQKAMTLAKAVQEVASTPLIDADGVLTNSSETLTVTYRSMTRENEDG